MSFEQDHLTDAARAALKRDAADAYVALVPDAPNADARGDLDRLSNGGAVKDAADRDADACCRAALWLWHDFLDESHAISQSVETPDGGLWHGVMHRREGDFSNAKYWFRRAGDHAAYPALAAEVQQAIRDEPADLRVFALTKDGWDPYAMVDLCETAHRSGDADLVRVAVAAQQAEWRVMFDHAVRLARGG